MFATKIAGSVPSQVFIANVYIDLCRETVRRLGEIYRSICKENNWQEYVLFYQNEFLPNLEEAATLLNSDELNDFISEQEKIREAARKAEEEAENKEVGGIKARTKPSGKGQGKAQGKAKAKAAPKKETASDKPMAETEQAKPAPEPQTSEQKTPDPSHSSSHGHVLDSSSDLVGSTRKTPYAKGKGRRLPQDVAAAAAAAASVPTRQQATSLMSLPVAGPRRTGPTLILSATPSDQSLSEALGYLNGFEHIKSAYDKEIAFDNVSINLKTHFENARFTTNWDTTGHPWKLKVTALCNNGTNIFGTAFLHPPHGAQDEKKYTAWRISLTRMINDLSIGIASNGGLAAQPS